MTLSLRPRVALPLMTALTLCALVSPHRVHARASGPVFWTVASQADFLKGQPSGVMIDAIGRLLPSPAISTVHDLAAPQAWSLAHAADGTWYAGTGGDGRVVRGRGTDVTTILDVEPAGIHALAAGGGRVFAGAGPNGAVHVIEPNGTSRVFFDPVEPYIWALALDAQNRLWVATGHPATLYRVAPDGTSTVVSRPPARHIVSLAIDQAGRVLAGTDLPARLYRIDTGDRASVLFESPLTELRTVQPTPDGGAFAVALQASGDAGGDAAVTGSVTITIGGAQVGSSSTSAASQPTGRRSVVYRLDAAGVWDAVWETTDAIYDLAVRDNQSAIVATGPEGRLYQINTDGSAQLLNAVDARQVTRLLRDGTRTLLATANPGRILALSDATLASPATYTSSVRDGKTLAQWGTIQWDGAGGATLQTRSGNTETPDESWSSWSTAYTNSQGQPITSAAARYLQWRATLPSGAVVTSVTVSYLPRNLRPVVTDITVHPAGVVFQRPFSSDDGAIAGLDDAIADARRPPGGTDTSASTSLGRRMYQRGLRTLQWKAEDPDNDRLQYTLQYRREGESTWRPLRSDLADPLFVWDTTSVADGRYFVRITASDALTNTSERVLTGSRDSDAIDIDNTPPVITVTITGLRADVRVVDRHSGVHRVDYAIGGQGWQALRPEDGLADSREERYVITLPNAEAASSLVVRASDVMQNVTSTSTGR